MQLWWCTNLQTVMCKNHIFSDSGIMIASRVPKQTLILDYQNKQLLCIGLTVTYEKVTLTRMKNTIKIPAKLYDSAISHSNDHSN